MTVYHLNNSLYFDLMNRLMPKMEDRTYCVSLQNALRDCSDKNYAEHPPCQQIEKFIKKLDCYSLEPRPLYPIQKQNHEFAKVMGKR